MIAICALTNGRIELLDRTLESLEGKLRGGDVTRRVVWDDSGSDEVYNYLRYAYGPAGWTIARGPDGAQGFGGAIRSSWRWLAEHIHEQYVFWTEDDFIYEKVVPLDAMMSVLDRHRHIAQVALKRQPWNDAERAAGDVVAMNKDAYVERTESDRTWLEHRLFWTTNPSLFRADLLATGWADDPESEGRFTHKLLGEGLPSGVPGHEVRFAYWGGRRSTPAVTHIGLERTGFGY